MLRGIFRMIIFVCAVTEKTTGAGGVLVGAKFRITLVCSCGAVVCRRYSHELILIKHSHRPSVLGDILPLTLPPSKHGPSRRL